MWPPSNTDRTGAIHTACCCTLPNSFNSPSLLCWRKFVKLCSKLHVLECTIRRVENLRFFALWDWNYMHAQHAYICNYCSLISVDKPSQRALTQKWHGRSSTRLCGWAQERYQPGIDPHAYLARRCRQIRCTGGAVTHPCPCP